MNEWMDGWMDEFDRLFFLLRYSTLIPVILINPTFTISSPRNSANRFAVVIPTDFCWPYSSNCLDIALDSLMSSNNSASSKPSPYALYVLLIMKMSLIMSLMMKMNENMNLNSSKMNTFLSFSYLSK